MTPSPEASKRSKRFPQGCKQRDQEEYGHESPGDPLRELEFPRGEFGSYMTHPDEDFGDAILYPDDDGR